MFLGFPAAHPPSNRNTPVPYKHGLSQKTHVWFAFSASSGVLGALVEAATRFGPDATANATGLERSGEHG